MKKEIKFKDLKQALRDISMYRLKYCPRRVIVEGGLELVNPDFMRWWRETEKEIKEYGKLCRDYIKQRHKRTEKCKEEKT